MIVEENTEESIGKLSVSFENYAFDHNDKVLYSNKLLNENINFEKLFDVFSAPITK